MCYVYVVLRCCSFLLQRRKQTSSSSESERVQAGPGGRGEPLFLRPISVRPVRLLRVWVSKGLTQAQTLNSKGWEFSCPYNCIGSLPESLTQGLLIGQLLVGGLGVLRFWTQMYPTAAKHNDCLFCRLSGRLWSFRLLRVFSCFATVTHISSKSGRVRPSVKFIMRNYVLCLFSFKVLLLFATTEKTTISSSESERVRPGWCTRRVCSPARDRRIITVGSSS